MDTDIHRLERFIPGTLCFECATCWMTQVAQEEHVGMKSLLSQSESLAHIIAPFPRATASNRLYHDVSWAAPIAHQWRSISVKIPSADLCLNCNFWTVELEPGSGQQVCVSLSTTAYSQGACQQTHSQRNELATFLLTSFDYPGSCRIGGGKQQVSPTSKLFFLNGLEQQPYLCRSRFPSSSDEFWVASASKSSFKR